jgi:hypothetical protein
MAVARASSLASNGALSASGMDSGAPKSVPLLPGSRSAMVKSATSAGISNGSPLAVTARA